MVRLQAEGRAAGRPRGLRRRGPGAVRPARSQGRDHPRHVRPVRHAGRRGPDDLVARREQRPAPGGVQPLPPHQAGPRAGAGVVQHGAAPPGRVQPLAHPGVPRRRDAPRLRERLPLRALLRLVPAARRGPPPHARRPRQDGPRLPGRARQHRRLVLARRLRVDPRLRGQRAGPHRRPDAPPARLRGPDARPRGDPVLHGPPQGRRPAGGRPGVTARPPAGRPPVSSGGGPVRVPRAVRRRRAVRGGGPPTGSRTGTC
ncbi:hypothetical protein SGPA1_10878 [Streptomyces misionensis JCM 4497]